MNKYDITTSHLDLVLSAQRVATRAISLGLFSKSSRRRPIYIHIGALMADAILQAGLSYRTVIHPRISRILINFPETKTLEGVNSIIESNNLENFLMWTHPIKLDRFSSLVQYFNQHKIQTTSILRDHIEDIGFRKGLLGIHGIGLKTVDYISCLSGIETISVDRHIITFAREAGIDLDDYEDIHLVFLYAADLLDISRRDFDYWVWETISTRSRRSNTKVMSSDIAGA